MSDEQKACASGGTHDYRYLRYRIQETSVGLAYSRTRYAKFYCTKCLKIKEVQV